MQYQELIYRVHARKSMFTRAISDDCVEHIIRNGEVIEDYPNAFPFPAKLLSAWYNGRCIHVVAAENSRKNQVIVKHMSQPLIDGSLI